MHSIKFSMKNWLCRAFLRGNKSIEAVTLTPLTGKVDDTDQLLTIQSSAGKICILTLTWVLF